MGMARLLKLESEGGICHVSNQLLADDDPASRQLVRGQPQSRRMDTQPRTQPVQETSDNPKPQDPTPFGSFDGSAALQTAVPAAWAEVKRT
jgi:hypothetical protein